MISGYIIMVKPVRHAFESWGVSLYNYVFFFFFSQYSLKKIGLQLKGSHPDSPFSIARTQMNSYDVLKCSQARAEYWWSCLFSTHISGQTHWSCFLGLGNGINSWDFQAPKTGVLLQACFHLFELLRLLLPEQEHLRFYESRAYQTSNITWPQGLNGWYMKTKSCGSKGPTNWSWSISQERPPRYLESDIKAQSDLDVLDFGDVFCPCEAAGEFEDAAVASSWHRAAQNARATKATRL